MRDGVFISPMCGILIPPMLDNYYYLLLSIIICYYLLLSNINLKPTFRTC